jgi:hypothetical protein
MADMATASHEYLRALNIVFDTLKRVNDLIFTAERAEIAESIQIAKQTIALDYFDEVLRFGPSLPIEDEENPDPLSYHDSEAETELETHRGDSRP